MQSVTNQGIKHFGFYRGVVLKHESNGYCKIFIPGVYPESFSSPSQIDNLPSAEQAAPLFGGLTDGDGEFSYPHINSVVWCFFQNGDQNLPVYFASTLGGHGAVEENDSDGEDSGWGFIRDNVSDEGNGEGDTTLNGEDSQKHVLEIGDTKIIWEESGTITVQLKDSELKTEPFENNCNGEYVHSEIVIDNTGSIELKSNSSITLASPEITLRADNSICLDSPAVTVFGDESIQVYTDQIDTEAKTHFKVKTPVASFDCSKSFIATGQNSQVNAM